MHDLKFKIDKLLSRCFYRIKYSVEIKYESQDKYKHLRSIFYQLSKEINRKIKHPGEKLTFKNHVKNI